MKISFVLPVYNQENSIADCIYSLMEQKYENFEIVLINDASTDHTTEIIDHMLQSNHNGEYDKKIDFIYESNVERKGAAKCRNRGNILATGDIIAVCDSDLYYKSRGDAIADFFEANEDHDLFCSALHYRDSKEPPQHKYVMEAYDWDFKSKCTVSHPTIAYRKRVIEKVRYQELSIDTDLYEFFLLDCHKEGYKMNGCQTPLMYKIEGNSNRKTTKAKKLKQKMYQKYGIEVQLG